LDIERCASGGIILSSVVTKYQLGFDFHAGSPILPLRASKPHGICESAMNERGFGTWQGRLPQELRLHGIGTVEAANAFLREHYIGEFNRRFQVASAQPGSAFMPAEQRIWSAFFRCNSSAR
jgi:hypothetical protein